MVADSVVYAPSSAVPFGKTVPAPRLAVDILCQKLLKLVMIYMYAIVIDLSIYIGIVVWFLW